MSPTRASIQVDAVTACILGAADGDWLAGLRDDLPAGTPVREFAEDNVHAVLKALASDPVDGDLLLIRGNSLLPDFWLPRILAALHLNDVLGVAALEAGLMPAIAPPADHATLNYADALCHAHGSRRALDAARLDSPLLALRGTALALLNNLDGELDGDSLPAPWRLLQMQDLLVAPAPDQAPAEVAGDRGLHLDLAHTLATAMEQETPHPGLPGYDGRPVILHILHGWGGGAARWVRDLAQADDAHHHVLLEAHGSFKQRHHGETFTVRDARADGPPWQQFTPARAIADTAIQHRGYREFLERVLADYSVAAICVSSLIGHSLDALRTGLPTRIMVHDHYPLWPLLHCNFGETSLRFDDEQLRSALAAARPDFEFAHREPGYWRALRRAFVEAAITSKAMLVGPSHSAMQAHLKLAPDLAALEQHVIPHGVVAWPESLPMPEGRRSGRLRLVVPGRIRGGKGAELLHAIVPAVCRHAELVLLGCGSEGMAFFGQPGVHVVLDYEHDQLPRLLAALAPDAALLLPTVAETYSYTLSEMRSLGLPVVATRVGALAERIDHGVDGLLVEPDADAVLECIAGLVADPQALATIRQHLAGHRPDGSVATMASAHRALLALNDKAPEVLAAVAGNAQVEALHGRNRIRQLQSALTTGAAQIAELEAEIERRGEWGWELDRAKRTLQALLDERTEWALSLDAELQALKPVHEQMLASRSWRLTRPLRASAVRLRAWREMWRFRLARLRSLRGRVRGSLNRRGVLGTIKRMRQEFDGAQPLTVAFEHPKPGADFSPFVVPTSDAPRVSIVIPVHGKFEYTAACLRSLAEHAATASFEVIVVDDASPDATPERLPQIAGIRVHSNAENLGFIGSCNAGAAMARGDYVLFLNNDTLVTAGWLEAMLDCFAERRDAGLVGARLIYPDGRLQESGGIVFDDGSGWNYGRLEHPDDPRMSFRRQADYCSGAAIMLPRALFEQFGGFDTRYAPAYYEDTDLAFQVRDAGKSVYVEPRAVVVHFEGVSNGTDTESESGIKRFQKINRDKFAHKWREQLAQHPRPIDDARHAHLAATWRARKRVLIVDASTPTPDQDSGSVRLLNIMRVLRDMGCQVTFLPDNLARFDKYTPLLQAEGVEALYHPFVESLPDFYRRRGSEFDLIMISRHYIAAHHLGLVRVHAPQARLVFDTVDLHYLREARELALAPRPELKRQVEATKRQELKLINESDVTLVVSKVEKELLARDAPGARVEILSNVHAIRGSDACFEERSGLLFVGGFQHPPNIDAMLWFVGEVLPLVHAELPEIDLHIVGSKLVPEIKALAGERVTVHGFVEDIEPMLEQARISIAPLRYGAGVKGKVNSAMSRGLPVVATPMAVEGIDAEAGRDVLVGESAQNFAKAVIDLYRNPRLWAELSRNGVENVRRQFSFDTARETLERLLDMHRD
ncbi:MAG: glycosyltransferase [Rhodanobacteraceae bacterium]